jgi:hypothetical protein
MCVIIWLCFVVSTFAVDLTPAITAGDIDIAQCAAFEGKRLIAAPSAITVESLLGLRRVDGKLPDWSTGKVAGLDRHFRIAFTHPVAIGTICTDYTGGRSAETMFQYGAGTSVAYLKAGAAYPGDVSDTEQWVVLPPGAVKTLPAGITTRALRFSDRRVQLPWANLEWGAESSAMGTAVLLKDRFYNTLIRGNSKVIKGASSDSWCGYWPEPITIDGMVSISRAAVPVRVETLKIECTEHPTLAPPLQWSKMADVAAAGVGPVMWVNPDVKPTRGIKLTPLQNNVTNNFMQVIPLTALAANEDAPKSISPAPFNFSYQMPMDGFAAIDINDKKTGKHVRRLVAEVARMKGDIKESWDLKDNSGRYVAPGDYTWSGITRPQIRLTYEGTVNNSGNPPWYAPVTGGGGWMSDHCTPVSVRSLGDKVFLGTYGAEYGQSIIATDLDGNKIWAGHLGADRMVADNRFLYTVTPSGVVRVDPQNGYSSRKLIGFSYTRDLPAGENYYGNFNTDGGSAAVFGDRLFVSYNAPSLPWIQSSFPDNAIDFERSVPRLKPRPKVIHEAAYDDRMKFFSVFMTGSVPSADVAEFGPSPKAGPLSGTLTTIFNRPVPVGSVFVEDGAIKVYALKPNVKLDAIGLSDPNSEEPTDEDDNFDPLDEEQWVPLVNLSKPGKPGLAVASPGILTRTLRFKTNTLRYCTVLSRRYKDIAPDAERICSEGAINKGGRWSVSRPATNPITDGNAPKYALVWKDEVSLRGAALIGTTRYGSVAVDYWVGTKDDDPAKSLDDDKSWKYAGTVVSRDSSLNCPQTPMAMNVDFGDNRLTRAIRIRATVPSGALVLGRPVITGNHDAYVADVIAYSYTPGQDPELPPALNERITEVKLPGADDNKSAATITQHVPVKKPTFMTFDKTGNLYVVSDRQVICFADGKLTADPKVVITRDQLQTPRSLAFDADGLLYVIDAGPCVVKVFNVTIGKLERTIGTPGGYKLGPYDPTRFDNPVDLTIDSAGKLWVTDEFNQPKRITRWSRDGKLEKTFMGPTYYGGGGKIDSGNHSVVNYLGMKFVMDYKTRQWKLESRTNRPEDSAFADRVIYHDGHRYLVGDECMSGFADPGGIAVIYEERDGIAVPLAAAGNLSRWSQAAKIPELRSEFKTLDKTKFGFVWSDANNDAIPQRSEVQITEKHPLKFVTLVGDDLSFLFRGQPGARIRPVSYSANGIPNYDMKSLEILTDLTGPASVTTLDGRIFDTGSRMLDKDGKTTLWSYPDNYASVQTSANAPGGFANRPAGVLVGELRMMGHFTIGGEELYVTNGNHGDWYAFTRDGLLAATIFGGPSGYGRRWWSMPECEPGKTDLTDLRLTVEDFYGSIAKCEDDKVYAVAGKNHNSIVRVDGLDKMQRIAGAFTVPTDAIQKSKEWEVQTAKAQLARMEPKIARFAEIDVKMNIDGGLDDWPDTAFVTIDEVKNEQGKVTQGWYGAVAWDNDNLYIAGKGSDDSPLKNSADDLTRVFQYGDGMDVMIGMDAKADPQRVHPVAGDFRLVISRVKGKPVIVLYRPVVPGTAEDKTTIFTSPVGKEIIDVVKVITDAEVKISDIASFNSSEWNIEVAIPWKSLGVDPPTTDQKLRGDFGVLISDQGGTATVVRKYWANKSQIILGDLPSEARITPALWGELRCIIPGKEMKFGGPDAGMGADDL